MARMTEMRSCLCRCGGQGGAQTRAQAQGGAQAEAQARECKGRQEEECIQKRQALRRCCSLPCADDVLLLHMTLCHECACQVLHVDTYIYI